MGNIYIDTSKLKNMYVGLSKVKKIYKDAEMIWQSAIPVAKPTQTSVNTTYNGSSQNNGYNMPSGVILTGNAGGTNAGTYTATYTPDADHIWADTEDRTPVTVTLTIGRASVGAKPSTTVNKTYNGNEQNNGYTTPTGVTMTGSAKGTNANTYTATYTPDSNHKWSDNSTSAVTVTMTIARASVGAKPSTSISKTYNGSSQNNGYTTPSGVNMSGNTSGTNAGTYTAIYTPDANHKWSDDTTAAVTVTMTIAKLSLTVPSVSGGGTYSGSAYTATISNFNGTWENQSGTVSAIDVGTYAVTWSLKDTANTQWADGTIVNKGGSWSIARASVGTKPTTAVSKDYNGSAQTNGYTKPSGVNMTGNASGTNGGTYSATYTPDSNHKWSDGSTGAVTVVLTINYAWTKWNARTTYTDNVTAINTTEYVTLATGAFNGKMMYRYEPTDIVLDAATGKYTFTGGSGQNAWITCPFSRAYQNDHRGFTLPVDETDRYAGTFHTTGWYNQISYWSTGEYFKCDGTKVEVTNTVGELHTAVKNYSKGSTNLGTVRSTNINAYPQNGTPDNTNWYVKNW